MKTRLRKGDLVEYDWWIRDLGNKKVKLKGIIQATSRDWYVIIGHVSINNCIVDIKKNKIKRITKREKLQEWWKYL